MSDLGSTVPGREGLPANYRMRADAHYVDQLVAPTPRRLHDDDARPLTSATKATSAPSSQSRPEPALPGEGELANALAAVLSCTDLLVEGVPRLTRTVALDMIRAETQRTICALRTSDVLKRGIPEDRPPVDPRLLLDQIVETITPETRLRGTRVTTAVEVESAVRLRADASCLASALSSVVLMLSAGLHDVHGTRLDLEIRSASEGRVTFLIRQDSVILPDAFLKVANSSGECAGSASVAPLVALRQVAEGYAGSLKVFRLPHGTEVVLDLPADVM